VKPEHAVTVNRKISGPFDAVYAACTEPEKMRGWMGEVEAQVKVGGSYRIRLREGGSAYVHQGTFELLEAGRRIVMTLQPGPEGALLPASGPQTDQFIELRFIPLGDDETEVWLLHGWSGEDVDDAGAKAIEAAWLSWLERLDAYIRR
jgi:uncharacterized protein YndB with AHSA1/START domain